MIRILFCQDTSQHIDVGILPKLPSSRSSQTCFSQATVVKCHYWLCLIYLPLLIRSIILFCLTVYSPLLEFVAVFSTGSNPLSRTAHRLFTSPEVSRPCQTSYAASHKAVYTRTNTVFALLRRRHEYRRASCMVSRRTRRTRTLMTHSCTFTIQVSVRQRLVD